MDAVSRLRHNTIIPEYPCSGEVIEYAEFLVGHVRIAICSVCGTEFQYLPDSDWLNPLPERELATYRKLTEVRSFRVADNAIGKTRV